MPAIDPSAAAQPRAVGAVAAAVVAVGFSAFAVLLSARVPAPHLDALDLPPAWADGIAGSALAIGGAAVARHQRHALGWLLTAFGVWWAFDAACGAWMAYATIDQPALPGAGFAFWVFMRLGAGLLLLLPLVLLLYPDGRLPSGRARVAASAALAATALLPVLLVVVPSEIAEIESGDAPLPATVRSLELDPFDIPLPTELWEVALRTSYLLVPMSLVVPFVVVVGRYRRATGLRRTRMRWLLWAGVVDLLVMLAVGVLPDAVSSFGLSAAVAVTAGAVVVGLTRPDLVDVDRLLDSTVVYGALVVASYLLDLALLGLAGSLLGAHLSQSESLVIAVFLVSLVYAPLRHRLWQLVRRSARGERDDPYGVVSRLAERLETTAGSAEQLLALARTVRGAFRTAYAGVEVLQADGSRVLVEDGTRPEVTDALPISYRGEAVGRLHLPRGPRERLRPADERLLADVVRQAAAAARAAQLADELQASRERLVTAVEDERRRLRNELHDGLGPTLAAVASRIDTARITGRRSSDEADAILATAREEVAGLLVEVRRLVHGLRPPALDDVGLAGAVRQQVERLRSPGLAVELETSGDLATLPAAVEVAAYRIVSETLTNVVRHACATHCVVRLTVDELGLLVEVVDDGVGIDRAAPAGVGLVSMRERARELGGTCVVEAALPRGSRVAARLPVAHQPAPDAGTVDEDAGAAAGGRNR